MEKKVNVTHGFPGNKCRKWKSGREGLSGPEPLLRFLRAGRQGKASEQLRVGWS